MPTRAAPGTTYRLLREGGPKFFIKLDEGLSTNWIELLSSVAGINLGTGAQVLKNIVGNQLQFRSFKSGPGVTVNQLANEIEFSAFSPSLKDQILTAGDVQRDITYIDFNTCSQRISEIEYTAASISPTASARKLFTYSEVGFEYEISQVSWIITP